MMALNPDARTRQQLARWAAVAILLLAAGFRVAALSRDARFHPDEAYFATFARSAAVQGEWLLRGALDKPPLAIYASALSMAAFGVQPDAQGVLMLDVGTGEWAARLPAALGGVVWVALMMALARRLYQRPVFALWVGLLAALSPMAILFGASAFTDGLLLMWGTAALLAGTDGRAGRAGLLLGLAFATKPQALFYLPLVVALGTVTTRWQWRGLVRFALGLGLAVGALLVWDSLRGGSPPVFALAGEHNPPAPLAAGNELLPRLVAWLDFGRGLAGPATALLAIFIAVFIVRSTFRQPRTRGMNADAVLFAFIAGYLTLHVLVGFDLYDRYVALLLPPFLLLSVRAGVWVVSSLSRWVLGAELRLAALVFAGVLLGGAVSAAGGDPGYERPGSSFVEPGPIDAVGVMLAEQQVAAVVYDHWLGWELDYYLGAWSDKRRVYFPEPHLMAAHAAALEETGPRFLPVPPRTDPAPWLDALAAVGFRAELAFEERGYRVYRLERDVVGP